MFFTRHGRPWSNPTANVVRNKNITITSKHCFDVIVMFLSRTVFAVKICVLILWFELLLVIVTIYAKSYVGSDYNVPNYKSIYTIQIKDVIVGIYYNKSLKYIWTGWNCSYYISSINIYICIYIYIYIVRRVDTLLRYRDVCPHSMSTTC